MHEDRYGHTVVMIVFIDVVVVMIDIVVVIDVVVVLAGRFLRSSITTTVVDL